MRVSDGKDNAIILDHAGNTLRHGFVEDIVPDELHKGETYKESSLTKETKEAKPNECPRCRAIMVGLRCMDCGHEIVITKEVVVSPGELQELERARDGKQREWFQMLAHYGRDKGYAEGWAAHKYRYKFGVFPADRYKGVAVPPNAEVLGYIKHLNIKAAKGRARLSQLKSMVR